MKLFFGYVLIGIGFFFYSLVFILGVLQVDFSLEALWKALVDPIFLLRFMTQSVSVFGLGIPFHLIGRRMVRQARKHP